MEHDPLTNLLQRADAAIASPTSGSDVARRVRQRRTRRRRIRTGGAVVAALLAVGLTFQVARLPRTTDAAGPSIAMEPNKATQVDPEFVRLELAHLERSRRVNEAVVKRLLVAEEQRSVAAKKPQPKPEIDVAMEMQWHREQAAAVLVRQGDRLAKELNRPVAAQVAYRQASDTFPSTHSGAIALERLTQHQ